MAPRPLSRDLVEAIVDECGKFCENVIAPLNPPAIKKAAIGRTVGGYTQGL